MPRERRGIDFSALADVPGALPKGDSKRDKKNGRSTPNSSLLTYKSLNKVNKKNAAAARAEAFGPQSKGCLRLPCFRCAKEGASVPHHEPPRKRGGIDKDTLPLCDLTRLGGVPGCHQLRHDKGEVTFWSKMGCTPDEAKEHVRLQIARLPLVP